MKIACGCGKNFYELPDDAEEAAPDIRFICRECARPVPQRDTTTYPYAFDHDLPRKSQCMIEPHANAFGITVNRQTGRPWIPAGSNVKKIRRVRKVVPAIANDGSL